jgi:hypothetical protein
LLEVLVDLGSGCLVDALSLGRGAVDVLVPSVGGRVPRCDVLDGYQMELIAPRGRRFDAKSSETLAHLLEQSVEHGRLADLEVTRVDTGVVNTEDHVDVLHGLGSDVGELLDLGGGVLDLKQHQHRTLIPRESEEKVGVACLTCSSLRFRLSCSTLDLTAFHPVNRWLRGIVSSWPRYNVA